MTAIKTTVAPSSMEGASQKTNHTKFTPSTTEEEAKNRFVDQLQNGVDKLLAKGNGRDRISTQLLNEIANGCSPDETEIFQTMETLGISLEDATKVMTVSSAFRNAQQQQQQTSTATVTNNAGAIDQLTSRLNLADLLRGGGNRSRSPSPLPSPSLSSTAIKSTISTPTASSIRIAELNRSESIDSLQSRNAARKGNTKKASTKQQQGRGRKRALADKAYEKRDSNVLIEEQLQQKKNKVDVSSSAAASSAADRELNAKLKSADKKLPASSATKKRAKSPESGGLGVARGKRTSVVATREESPKRKRTRSQTEESIPDILLP